MAANAATTMGLGISFSLFLGPRLTPVDISFDTVPQTDRAILNLLLVVALVGWGLHRSAHPRRGLRPWNVPYTMSSWRLVVTGMLFGVMARIDPAFYGVVVLAGRGNPAWATVMAHLIWYAVSQSPLPVLLRAVLAGR